MQHPFRWIGATTVVIIVFAVILAWADVNARSADDLASWATFWNALAAIGTVGATITVVSLAWREAERDRRREARERREQATKVDVRVYELEPPDEELAPFPEDGMSPTRSIVVVEVRNYSDLPLADVRAGVTVGGFMVSPYGGPPNPDPEYMGKNWSSRPLTPSDLVRERSSPLESSAFHVPERTVATPRIETFDLKFVQSSAWAEPAFTAYVTFTDFAGVRWRRTSDFVLTEQTN